MSNNHDTCIVIPTLPHAIYWWPRIQQMLSDYHGEYVRHSKTGSVSTLSNTMIRLWVPYGREPTLPMDVERYRRGFDLAYLYGMARHNG